MKKLTFVSPVTAALMRPSCIATRSTTKINQVEAGMTKEEISKLLGKPMFKNGDPWKSNGATNQGKVIGYETMKNHPHHHQ